ncbi:hypothetical protein THAOC_33414, partial [Thalassiosira oceanica]
HQSKFPVGTSVLAMADGQAIRGTISEIHADDEDLALPSYSIDIEVDGEEMTIHDIAEERIMRVSNVRRAAAGRTATDHPVCTTALALISTTLCVLLRQSGTFRDSQAGGSGRGARPQGEPVQIRVLGGGGRPQHEGPERYDFILAKRFHDDMNTPSRNTSTRNENAPAPGEHGAGQPQIRLEERRAPARHEANTDRRQERLRGTHHSEGSQEIQGRGGAPGGPAAPEHDAWSSDQRGGGKLQGRQWDVACCMDRPRNGHEAAVQTDLCMLA